MWRATFKSLLAKKLRLVLTAFSVVLGVGFVAGTYVLTDTMNAAFEELFEQTSAASDVVVRSASAFEASAAGPGGGSGNEDREPRARGAARRDRRRVGASRPSWATCRGTRRWSIPRPMRRSAASGPRRSARTGTSSRARCSTLRPGGSGAGELRRGRDRRRDGVASHGLAIGDSDADPVRGRRSGGVHDRGHRRVRRGRQPRRRDARRLRHRDRAACARQEGRLRRDQRRRRRGRRRHRAARLGRRGAARRRRGRHVDDGGRRVRARRSRRASASSAPPSWCSRWWRCSSARSSSSTRSRSSSPSARASSRCSARSGRRAARWSCRSSSRRSSSGCVASVIGIVARHRHRDRAAGAARGLQHRPAQHVAPTAAAHDRRLAASSAWSSRSPRRSCPPAERDRWRPSRPCARPPTRRRRGSSSGADWRSAIVVSAIGAAALVYGLFGAESNAATSWGSAPRSRSSASRCCRRSRRGRSPAASARRCAGCRSRRGSAARTRCAARGARPRRRPR